MNSSGDATAGKAVEEADEQMLPPEHLFSDYIEIAYLGAVIVAGLAFNFCVLKRLLREKRQAERGSRPENAFLLLKLNLNISDLLILLIHALGKLAWLITYEWRGGDALCRLFNFLSMFTLYLSSNIVICIALDRLLTVLKAQKISMGQRKLNIVRFMLCLAWSLSLLFSLPQLFVWTTYNPFRSSGWVQCTDIWSIDRYERYLDAQQSLGGPKAETATSQQHQSPDGWTQFALSTAVQNGYELGHLFLVFYGPLIVLLFCYAIISTRLIRFAKNNPRNTSQQPTSQENGGHSGIVGSSKEQHHNHNNCKRASIKSFPAVRLCTSLDRLRRKSHHPVPMIDIHEVSTRAEETCSSNIPKRSQGEESTTLISEEASDNHPRETLLQPKSGNELPEEDFPSAPGHANAILMSRCGMPNGGCPHSYSTVSSLSSTTLQPNGGQSTKKPKRILVRLSDLRHSLRNSIGRRLKRPRDQLGANLALHCSLTGIGPGSDVHQLGEGKELEEARSQKETTCWGWHLCHLRHGEAVQQRNGSTGRHQPPPAATAAADVCRRHSTVNQSIRSSVSTTATLGPLSTRHSQQPQQQQHQPLWRRHLRSRAFRATLLVILAHIILWSPYNVYALMKHINEQLYERMSEQANVLKDLQFLIVLINPFLYGFGRRVQGKEREQPQRTGGGL